MRMYSNVGSGGFGRTAAGALMFFAVSMFAFGAQAVVISSTNSTFGSVDDSFDMRTFTFNAGDFPGSSIVTRVSIEIDFSKCGDAVDATGCTGDGRAAGAFVGEIGFALTSPGGITVALVENDRGNEAFETGNFETFNAGEDENDFSRVVILFDDAGAALGNLPVTGTFAPEELLSAFINEDGIGVWSLFFEDDRELDPLGFHTATLNITVADGEPDPIPNRLPEPGALALFGFGLLGLAYTRRRRRAA